MIRPDHVACYVRWSTDEQTTGTTLEVQRDGCIHYARSQGWEIPDNMLFVDEGYSGATLDRPAITRLRTLVQSGQVDCVIVLKLDRLSRNIVDATSLVLREWAGKCDVKSVREPIDTTTDLGRTIFSILSTFADLERAVIRDRTLSGKVKRLTAGEGTHGAPPLGYTMNPGQKGWVEDPVEAELVRRIFDLAASGVTLPAMAKTLHREGLRTRPCKKAPLGAPFTTSGLHRILRNPVYTGQLIWGRTARTEVKGKRKRVEPSIDRQSPVIPALVSQEVWDRAQEQLTVKANQKQKMGGKAMGSPHLLTGLARCGVCGGAMVHKPANSKTNPNNPGYYVCNLSRSGACTDNGNIPVLVDEWVEADFLRHFGLKDDRERAFSPNLQAVQTRRNAAKLALNAAEKEKESLDIDDDRILRAARSGQVALEDLNALRSSIRRDRAELEERIKDLQSSLAEAEDREQAIHSTLSALESIDQWEQLEVATKRRLIHMALKDKISLFKTKSQGKRTGNGDIKVVIPWVSH